MFHVLLIFRDYVEICNSSVDRFTQHVSYFLMHHWLILMFQVLVYKPSILLLSIPLPCSLLVGIIFKKKEYFANTRSANDDFLLVIPPISRNCSNLFFKRSFRFASPTEWNTLDARIRCACISNLNCFKREIKTILFQNYFDV